MALVSNIISSWILWKSSQLLEKNGSCQNKSLKVIGTRWPQATQAFPFPELLLLFANAILFIFSVELWLVFLLLLFSTISDLVVFSVWGLRCKVSVLISVMLFFLASSRPIVTTYRAVGISKTWGWGVVMKDILKVKVLILILPRWEGPITPLLNPRGGSGSDGSVIEESFRF